MMLQNGQSRRKCCSSLLPMQDADIVALVPQSWAPIIEASMRGSNMQDMKTWAVNQAQIPIQPNSPDMVKKLSAHRKMNVFQGVAMADYNLVGMLARMLALGVILRPSEIFEHKPGDYNKTYYQKEATSKIMLFEMVEYKQVLYMDADGLVLRNLDAVFNLNMTPMALLQVGATESLQYHTHVMLLQPSKSTHAQLQFVVEKDWDHDDVRILSDFFSGRIHSLPGSLALQSNELRISNRDRVSGKASTVLHDALYVHLVDSPDFPKHWQWANPSRIPNLLPACTETCEERTSWLYVYSMLSTERKSFCTISH
ncbi:TPA: glycogenin glucosyltransferase [Trebouxia sp. C0004]